MQVESKQVLASAESASGDTTRGVVTGGKRPGPCSRGEVVGLRFALERGMRALSILVPTDFSEGSLVAIEMALDFGAAFRVPPRLTLVHVWAGAESHMPELTLKMDAGGSSARLLVEARTHGLVLEHAAEFLSQLEKRGITGDAWMMRGPVAETIASAAGDGDFDLVVMGTHGRGGLSGAILGSVAEKVVRLSKVPVLTTRMRLTRSMETSILAASR